jgi:hypothetical protein
MRGVDCTMGMMDFYSKKSPRTQGYVLGLKVTCLVGTLFLPWQHLVELS